MNMNQCDCVFYSTFELLCHSSFQYVLIFMYAVVDISWIVDHQCLHFLSIITCIIIFPLDESRGYRIQGFPCPSVRHTFGFRMIIKVPLNQIFSNFNTMLWTIKYRLSSITVYFTFTVHELWPFFSQKIGTFQVSG